MITPRRCDVRHAKLLNRTLPLFTIMGSGISVRQIPTFQETSHAGCVCTKGQCCVHCSHKYKKIKIKRECVTEILHFDNMRKTSCVWPRLRR